MTFENLESWQAARQLVKNVYVVSRKEPICKDFGICGQIQRASVSIMSNIAEGFERFHVSEKSQHYNIARGSTAEVRSLSYVIEDNFPNCAADALDLRDQAVAVGRLVTGLIQSTDRRKP